MRIGLVTSNLGQGGVGRNMLNLAQVFIEKGIEVDLFLVNPESGSRLCEVPCVVNIYKGSGRARSSLIKLVRYLRARKPDAIISGPSRINPLCVVAKAFSRKDVILVTTYRSNREREWLNMGKGSKAKESLSGYLYKFSDALVGVSEGVTTSLKKTLPACPSIVTTIYNPAYQETVLLSSRSDNPHPWLGPRKHWTLVSAGRLEKQKDYPTLLRAIEILNRKIDVRLVVLGDGSLRDELSDVARAYGVDSKVAWIGYVDDVRSYIRASDGFVLSSLWEGFGNVLVEALAEGVPVVSTDCPSGPSEILGGGKYGWLVPTQNPEELAHAIHEMISKHSDSDALRARAKEFSAEAAANNYLKLIEEIANSKST